jgi:hypothetical protein
MLAHDEGGGGDGGGDNGLLHLLADHNPVLEPASYSLEDDADVVGLNPTP